MAQDALSGFRKFKTPYVDQINAKKGYLPALYNQRNQNKYQDKSFDLQQQGLDQNAEFAQQGIDLQEDALHQQKKRDKLASTLGYAGLGMNAGFGVMNNYDALSDLFSPEDAVGSFIEPSSMAQGLGEAAISDPYSFGFDSLASAVAPSIKDFASSFGGGGIFDGLVGDSIDFGSGWDTLGAIF